MDGSVWVKVFAVSPADLNSGTGTFMVEGENKLLQVIFWPPHGHHGICTHTYIHNINKCKRYFKNLVCKMNIVSKCVPGPILILTFHSYTGNQLSCAFSALSSQLRTCPFFPYGTYSHWLRWWKRSMLRTIVFKGLVKNSKYFGFINKFTFCKKCIKTGCDSIVYTYNSSTWKTEAGVLKFVSSRPAWST